MMAARELMFARELLVEFGVAIDGPSRIYSDSKSAVEMAFDPVSFKKTKHILRAAEFLRDLVARQVIHLEHLAGARMIADLLTKAPARQMFRDLMALIDTYAASGVACLKSDS